MDAVPPGCADGIRMDRTKAIRPAMSGSLVIGHFPKGRDLRFVATSVESARVSEASDDIKGPGEKLC